MISLSISNCCDDVCVQCSDSSKLTGSDAWCAVTWLGYKSCMCAVYLLVDAATWRRCSWQPGVKDCNITQ